MTISSTRVLLASGEICPATVVVEAGYIQEVRPFSRPDRAPAEGWNVGDLLVAPGMVDIHGDAFERQWMPRARVFFPLEIALFETDRQLLANGITTAYHGLTVSWEPGLRGIEHGRLMMEALDHMRGKLTADTRLHLRLETYAIDEAGELLRWIEQGKVAMIGFNDHLKMIAAHLEIEQKAAKYAERSGLSIADFRDLTRRVASRAPQVDAVVAQVAAAAGARHIPIASHDDETPEMRARYRNLGSRICEFPVDAITAASAIDDGSHVVLGSPNVVRGGSHAQRMTAAEAVSRGLCTVLASDYYYPSMLHSVFRLVREGVLPLTDAWRLVSRNPADAAALPDRGSIAAGMRADLLCIEDSDPLLPRVAMTMAAGRVAYLGEPSLLESPHVSLAS